MLEVFQRDIALYRIENISSIIDRLTAHFRQEYSNEIRSRDIFDAIFVVMSKSHDFEWGGDLWDVDMEYEEVLNLLSEYDFHSQSISVELPNSNFPDGFFLRYKSRIKANGTVWIIHRYDADPFPSNPHAHHIDSNIKLDLSNGKCYKNKVNIYSLKKKNLLEIREKAMVSYKGELPALSI